MTTGDRTYDANASAIQQQVSALQAAPGGLTFFDPVGGGSGNRYLTLADAVAAARAAGPRSTVVMLAPGSTVPGNLDVSGVTIAGYGSTQPILTVVEGTSFSSADAAVRFDNVVVSWTGLTPPVEAQAAPGFAAVVLTTNAQLSANASTGPFAHAGAGLFLISSAGLGCQVDGSGGSAVLAIAAGGAFMFCDFYPGSSLASNSLTGGDAASIFVTDYGALSISLTQAGTTGIVSAAH